MIKIYRAMCEAEFNGRCVKFPFSWNSKNKWFTDNYEFILSRVRDGVFNNSKFRDGTYSVIVEYTLENITAFRRVSDNELMLNVKDANKVKVVEIRVLQEPS